jgi:HD superfamily phosphohydrolase YqeK
MGKPLWLPFKRGGHKATRAAPTLVWAQKGGKKMKCPGQDTQYWKPDAIFEATCPKCGSKIEFFKDDTSRKCKNCGHRLVNPKMDFGCALYCQFAEQCIGYLPDEALSLKENLLKDKAALEMKRYFKKDFKRIGHALKVAHYAEKICKKEEGDMAVIMCAAYLHDIGIHEAERKYNSSAPRYQEIESPPIAKSILSKLNANQKIIDEVCDIISHHHHPKKIETTNFKILYDADRISNLKYNIEDKNMKKNKIINIIEKQFLTETGKDTAKEVLL